MDYVDRYAKYFHLDECVQLNTHVSSVEKTPKGWLVIVMRNNQIISEKFDAVAVCSGQAAVPRKIEIQGQEHFTGNILHTSELHSSKDFIKFHGNRVLVVGGGETASDVLLDIVDESACSDISLRNPLMVLPRNVWGGPHDYTEPRTLFQGPRWIRWSTYKLSVLTNATLLSAFARQYRGETQWVTSALPLWKLLFTGKYVYECLARKRSLCSSIQFTKSDSIYQAMLRKDKCHVRGGVCHFNKEGEVVFEDNTKYRYDFIVLATGYRPSEFPFLPQQFRTNHLQDRFLGVFHPDLEVMAFIEFMRGNVGSLVLGFEMQARWFALVCSSKRSLPDSPKIRQEIALAKKKNHAYNGTIATWFYANYLARYHVLCEPNFVKFFAHHPMAAIKAYFGNFTGYKFRMQGPHRNIKAVLDGYALTNGIFYLPWSWHVLQIILTIQAPFFEILSHLPLIGVYFEPLLSQWY